MPKSKKPQYKFEWQQLVADCFRESHAKNLALKINAAERALSARLLDYTRPELDESIALKEALRVLRALLPETTKLEASKKVIKIA